MLLNIIKCLNSVMEDVFSYLVGYELVTSLVLMKFLPHYI